jgi:hypothetical protein
VERTEIRPTTVTCSFDGGDPVPLATATYELTLRATRSGEPIADPIRIDPDNQECPSSALVDQGDPEVYVTPSDAQVRAAVRSYVGS